EFRVPCQAPIRSQRLHVLVLNPLARDAKALENEVLKAVRFSPDGKPLDGAAFSQVSVQRPLIGSRVEELYIAPRLLALKADIRNRSRTDRPMNEVVLIYYQGGEAIGKDGHFFQTYTIGSKKKQVGIRCDRLMNYLAEVPGAHVLLLDVHRTT